MVLNNRPEAISELTRQAVRLAVKELNYRPNQLARSLVTKKTNTIALIIPDNTNLFFAAVSNAVEDAANALDYSVIVANTKNSPRMNAHYLRLFADRMTDGIIAAQSEFASLRETEECVRLLQNLHLPIVLVDRIFKGAALDYVGLDQFEGGYLATRHLLDLGHRRIGCATGPLTLSSLNERLEGYRSALEGAGIAYDPSLVHEGELQLASGAGALPHLLGKNVSAIFAFNDMIAYGIYKEIRNYDLRIPNDLSIIGFDDIVFSDIIQPPLTTVAQPIAAIAGAAVRRLAEIIRNPGSPRGEPQILKPLLKVRGSTRSPRQR
jgi:LacI family transcriptional regulator